MQFDTLHLKSLTGLSYGGNERGKKYYIERDLNGNGYIDENDIITTDLAGNGSFSSEEAIAELEKCDIVVTNPPFSLFRDFLEILMRYEKKFLIIFNKNAMRNKATFPLIKEGKIWLGVNTPNNFITPDEGEVKKINGLCRWLTNLNHSKRNEPMTLTATYYNPNNRREDYPKYDNYDAINVDKVVNIPKDYAGVMGVPITFLDKHCPDQFEILGSTRHNDQNMDGGYWLGGHNDATINGKEIYSRLLIRNLHPELPPSPNTKKQKITISL